ncbi:MAG: hypothetical protein ACHQE5_04720 [Actinomycetes bacterium]
MITDDELHEALSHLAGRADADPRPDRLDRVHHRARRTRRTRAVAASLAAVVVIGGAAAVIARSADTASPVVPGTHPPVISSAPSTGVPTNPPTTTPTPATSPTSRPTTTPTTSALVPADSRTPSAGGCLTTPGLVVTVYANPDVPTPRCVLVRPDQRLRVVNSSALHGSPPKTITVGWANYPPRVLKAGQSTTYDKPFGAYLAVGVHNLRLPPLYAGSFGAVWLR